MKQKGLIRGVPLIKFKSRKLVESLQTGTVYLNCLKWFRDYEDDAGNVVVGDSFEGMLHVNEGQLIIQNTGKNEKLNNSLLRTVSSNAYVYCMTYIDPKADEFRFSESQKTEFREFGDSALVIYDSNEFLRRIKAAAKEQGYRVFLSNVHYYDPNEDCANVWVSLLNGMHNIAFWKRNSYMKQQEFRIVIPDDGYSLDHLELKIGDISDISEIFSIEEVLEMEIKRCSDTGNGQN